MLIVIAVRTLRSNRVHQKLFSIVVLAGGLVIGRMGVEPVAATVADFIFVDGKGENACADGTYSYDGISENGDITVTNNCDTPVQITPSIDENVFPDPACYELVGGNCGELDTGATCTLPQWDYAESGPRECEV